MTRGDGRSLAATSRVCVANSLSKRSLRQMHRPVVVVQADRENLDGLRKRQCF